MSSVFSSPDHALDAPPLDLPIDAAASRAHHSRSFIMTLLCVALSACATTVPVDPITDPPLQPQRRLEVLSDARATVLFGDSLNVTVRYFDENDMPIPGAPVDFALVGRANDSSLAEPTVVTDDVGVVDAVLQAGMTASVFKLRARAEGAEPVFIEVSISDSGFGELSVTPSYEGSRVLDQFSASLFVDSRCSDDPEMMEAGDRTAMRSAADTEPLHFAALAAGVPYSIVVRGHGPQGTVLVWGCVDAVQFNADEQREIEVLIQDLALESKGSYTGTLKVAIPAAGTLLENRVSQTFNTTATDEVLFNAILESRGFSAQVADLGEWDGFSAMRTELIRRVAALDHLSVNAAIHVDEQQADFQLLELWAGAEDQLVQVTRLDDRMRTRLVAEVARDGGTLVVESLTLGLPVSIVASTMIDRGRDEGANLNVWAEFAKCQELSLQVSVPGCDSECVRNACRQQVEADLLLLQEKLSSLDRVRNELTLSGSVSLRDKDSDLQVDTVTGTLLRGTWTGPESTLDDAVIGEFDGARVQRSN